jgi:hypothetical protein
MHAIHTASQGKKNDSVGDITAGIGSKNKEKSGKAHRQAVHCLARGGSAQQILL